MHTFVIFGASGDLTRRKLVPALYQLHRKGRLPTDTRIVGFSRTKFTHEVWREKLAASTAEHTGDGFDRASWDAFAESIFYLPGDLQKPEDFGRLKALLDEHESGGPCSRVYYLATAPQFYAPAVANLGASGLASDDCGPRHLVVEKPFGTDQASAQRLNETIHREFAEHQVYRIDHYLGKETVQNLLVLRFANTIFEPIWNRNYVDHVQITVAEEVTVEGRTAYYDTAGILRDMFQNHLLQLLMFTAMDAPVRATADMIRDEKVEVLQAIRPLTAEQVAEDTVRGQYRGYAGAAGAGPESRTATFAAVKLWIDNWRWQGVPFYLRSGKAMSCRTTQIVVQFRKPPLMLFGDSSRTSHEANRLVIQVQPAEGIQLHFQTKVPDAGMKMRLTDLDFRFGQEFRGVMPGAYERLLLDAMQGDASLFARSDEVELAWGIFDPVIAAWRDHDQPPVHTYEPNHWGPPECTAWMQAQGRQWFDTCPVLQ